MNECWTEERNTFWTGQTPHAFETALAKPLTDLTRKVASLPPRRCSTRRARDPPAYACWRTPSRYADLDVGEGIVPNPGCRLNVDLSAASIRCSTATSIAKHSAPPYGRGSTADCRRNNTKGYWVPHLSIEYSPGVEARTDIFVLCRALHSVMLASTLFPDAGIRVRAHKADHAVIADGLTENDFVAMTLSVGAGRRTEDLRAAGDALFAAGQEALAGPLSTSHFAFSLEIREINADLSWKDTPIHARLSGTK